MARWKLRVRRHTYRSTVDGSREPFRVYLPRGYRRLGPRPLVILLHGFGGNEKGGIGELTAELADERGYLLLSPRGRGSAFYDGVAEDDFFETFERVKARYPVDEDRVYLMGTSMGGLGAWRLACRFPHLFAAVAPICGWTDWRLWYPHWYAAEARPKHVIPWRRPLVERATVLSLAANLINVPVCVLHGARDPTVLVQNSRRMVAALRRCGADVTYKEYARSKHRGFRGRWRAVFDWFEGRPLRSWGGDRYVGPASPPGPKRRVTVPERVIYCTNSLRHNRAYWVRIDELADPNALGRVEATVTPRGEIELKARGVNALTLLPRDEIRPKVRAAGRVLTGRPGQETRLRRAEDGRWSHAPEAPRGPETLRKRPGSQGPIADAFVAPFRLVAGSAAEDRAEAEFAAMLWQRWMMPRDDKGRPRGRIPVLSHEQITPEHVAAFNLVLFGRPQTHSVLRRIADRLPLRITRNGVRVGGRAYEGPSIGLRMIYPNPLSPDRYVVVWFGHMPMRAKDLEGLPWLLPDYVVSDAARPCGRTAHPQWDAFDRQVAAGEICPHEMDEHDKPQLYLPDSFAEAGFFDAAWRLER